MGRRKKILESMSICTVVSFGKSSRCALKIAMVHTVGSTVTLVTMGSGSKAGTSFTPTARLKKMFALNGHLETEAKAGNNQLEKLNEI